MPNQQRLDAIASQFGDRDKISIFLGREKIYPAKELSDATVERLENALRSPESEKGTLRVLEETIASKKAELIYRSSQGALDFDPKNVAPQFQAISLSQQPGAIQQVEQKQATEQSQKREQPQSEKAVDNSGSENKTNTVLEHPTKDTISFPINPTETQIDEKMQEILKPISDRGSLEETLAAAHARIDALQS